MVSATATAAASVAQVRDRHPGQDLPAAGPERGSKRVHEPGRVDVPLAVDPDRCSDRCGQHGFVTTCLLTGDGFELDVLTRRGDLLQLVEQDPAVPVVR